MKKLFYLLVLIGHFSLAQVVNQEIPINQFTTTQLIFDPNEEIEIVDVGTGDAMVGQKIIKNVLLLQSSVRESEYVPTNCFIKTKKNYYNFMLVFEKNPQKQTYIVNPETFKATSVGNTTTSNNSNLSQAKPLKKENSFIEKIKNKKNIFRPATTYNSDVVISFYGCYFDAAHSKIYYKFLVDNNSDLPYTFGEIFTTINKQKKKNSTDNERPIYPKEIIKEETIKGKSKDFVYFVFDQFSVNRKEDLKVEFKEKNPGQRDFILRIPFFVVNKPEKI